MDKSLQDLFRDALGQSTEQEKVETKRAKFPSSSTRTVLHPTGVERPRNNRGDKYQSFLDKYNDLERFIDGMDATDLTYYFREKAKEAGYKYHISNMHRDIGIFKNLLKDYEPREVALMIEFIFFSEQDYLTKDITQPTVLASSFVNRVYRDSKLWVDDEYVPESKQSRVKPSIKKREWKSKPKHTDSKIGEW